ncbi:UDP-glucose 4-epimerase GalE [Kribbella sandramycini]|uniref:UDP-glucose 4-epimerase n=1 Tax=Kribbella sandramycini TaxID=60450 RepID=A0A7Y4L5N0_9ACTN|nr:UDP-glucose 4-epimerase GalE [Kribbella sandramycini]MBB6567126.1 UDP-glucose 4-epimerase [Kribbella sandramycini]NOL44843.1 UDP-glucose 4-epimerase GalE [Kribbella sandramycini]
MTWLVSGGAGYIGAHVVRAFLADGIDVVVVDDLSSGKAEFVPDGVPFVQANLLDGDAVRGALAGVSGVVHLAGYKYAGVSVERPLHTYTQNVSAMVSLLEAMDAVGVRNLVFSSSAGVYGTPTDEVVTEETAPAPESPYGETKLIGEWLLRDQAAATELHHTSLRYFNVVGSGDPEVYDASPYNLFPIVCNLLSQGKTPQIYGTDHPTPDGTSVKDYVHVADLARAHVAAARALDGGTKLAPVYNLGSGTGTSVRQIMDAARRVTGIDFTPGETPRRPGDPSRVVANGDLATRDLGWQNTHTVDEMFASAWAAWPANR